MIHSKRKINSALLFERKILFILFDCGATHITRWKITQNYATDLISSQRLKGSNPILASKRVLICHVRLWSQSTGLFNLISPVPSTDDLSKSWRVISDWTIVPFYELFHIHLTSYQFTPHGRYELNKLTSLPMSGFIVQLVEHRTSIAQITGSNPVEAQIFSGFFFPIAQIGKLTVMIILHFHLKPQFKYELPPFSFIRDFGKLKNLRETFPKFPSVLRVIDRSDWNPPIPATSVTF